ncbi:hypothetical protein QCA50_002459 [Cerrena zonata]|uniref:Homeobox domain-containing protein n=1 Tax=Cerrena zonata TaxID=2478898 RepID=A0AAW0GVL0_9APHY
MSQRLDIQQRIVDRSHEFLRRINAAMPYQPARSSTKQLPVTPLPYPSPISAAILKAGASSTFADLASSAYLRDAFILKRECERHIQHVSHVWVETSDTNQETSTQLTLIYNIFVSYYRQTLNDMVERVLSLVRTRLQAPGDKKERRDTFNKGAIPMLESFYSQNPFPSSAEKRRLAQQTKLTLDQIRVWFQNRRARAKRAGQPPTRTLQTSNFILCQRIPSGLEVEIDRLLDSEIKKANSRQVQLKTSDDNATSATKLRQSNVLWPLDAPAHAFPTPYHPPCEGPFAVKESLTNFDLPWIRETQHLRRIIDHTVPDLGELVDAFSGLFISDSSSAGQRSTSPESDISYVPSIWVPKKSSILPPVISSHFTSDLKPRPKRKLSAKTNLRVVNAGTSVSKSNDSSPRTMPYPRTKPRPLPRRIPQSQPQLIDCHRSLPHSRPSRSPSASSFASDDSFSSYASSSDSELGTPPPISINLPMYSSEKELPASYISPISSLKLPQALSKFPVNPRSYTFRTTIAPS